MSTLTCLTCNTTKTVDSPWETTTVTGCNDCVTLHAHVEHYSADCDGSSNTEYTMEFNEDEKNHSLLARGVNDFSEIYFMERVLCNVTSPYSTMHTTITMTPDGIESHESTEEGHSTFLVKWCRRKH